jgi:acyl-CoA synthetase (NDP forming)
LNTSYAGFKGRLYAVNTTANREAMPEAHFTFVTQFDDIAERIDVLAIAVRRERLYDAVVAGAAAGARFFVIPTAGLGEIDVVGTKIEASILEVIRSAGARLLGPNCFGVASNGGSFNLTPRRYIPDGNIALITQSGNAAVALLQLAAGTELGFASCTGVGNQIDVGFGELLLHVAGDAAVAAVALYVEGLAFGKGELFLAGLEACARASKPVVVIKGGRSASGASVALSHTRALASDDRVWDTVLQARGVVRVDSTEQAMDALQAAVRIPHFHAGIAVVTDGGGDSVMLVDALTKDKLSLARPCSATMKALDALLPQLSPRTANRNPLTIDGPQGVQDDLQLFVRCVEVLAADPHVSLVVVGGVFGGYADLEDAEARVADALIMMNKSLIPIVMQSAFASPPTETIRRLMCGGIAVFPTAARLASALADRQAWAVGPAAPPALIPRVGQSEGGPSAHVPVVMASEETVYLLNTGGIKLPVQHILSQQEEWRSVAGDLRFPLVVKLGDPKVVHKSDVCGVKLGLATPADVDAAVSDLRGRFPGSSLLVMEQLPQGMELLVGAHTDSNFGTIVTVGRGGIWAELEDDTLLLESPFDSIRAVTLLRRLRCFPMIVGGRGQPKLDIDSFAQLVVRMGDFAAAHPKLIVDLNPVILYERGWSVADARLLVA